MDHHHHDSISDEASHKRVPKKKKKRKLLIDSDGSDDDWEESSSKASSAQRKKPPKAKTAHGSKGSGNVDNESINHIGKPRKKHREGKKERVDDRAKAAKKERIEARAKAAKNKRVYAEAKEAKKEWIESGSKANNMKSTEVKQGRPQPTRANGSSYATRPSTKQQTMTKKDLKPVLEVGAKVYAAWWPSAVDKRENNDPSWYPGTIKSVEVGKTLCSYGPTRYYSIEYDDGDELDHVDDIYVFSRREYALLNKDEDNKRWLGNVRNIKDSGSMDEWARYVGWWAVTIDGRSRPFGLLSEALMAYDASVIRSKGDSTKPSDLNLPNEWSILKRKKKQK